MKQKTRYSAALIAVSAMFAAMLVGCKQALAVLPNIEVVTLLISLCAYVWGPVVVFPAVNVFIAVDMAIWGVNTWIISYFIHWNVVAVVFWLLSKAHFKHKGVEITIATLLAAVLTTLFGVVTSVVDTLVGFTGKGFFLDFDDFLVRFAVMYARGWLVPYPYFGVQILCNIVLFATAFLPLVLLNRKARFKLLSTDEQTEQSV